MIRLYEFEYEHDGAKYGHTIAATPENIDVLAETLRLHLGLRFLGESGGIRERAGDDWITHWDNDTDTLGKGNPNET